MTCCSINKSWPFDHPRNCSYKGHLTKTGRGTTSTAKRLDQGFFLLLGEVGERVEGSEISAERRGGEACKHFGGEPGVASPAAGKQDERADRAQNNLHAESDQD